MGFCCSNFTRFFLSYMLNSPLRCSHIPISHPLKNSEFIFSYSAIQKPIARWINIDGKEIYPPICYQLNCDFSITNLSSRCCDLRTESEVGKNITQKTNSEKQKFMEFDPNTANSMVMTIPQNLIPNLPDEISLRCIARVPRSHHFNLSLVSKSWRSLLRSPLFYTVRSQISSTQYFLYITVRTPHPSSSFQWLVLDPHAPNPKKLSPLPSPPSSAVGSATAVLGTRIFVIGGSVADIPSSNVWVFDTRFNRWEEGPKMRVSREFAAAGVIGGKVYVLGGCLVDSWARSFSWAEVFDPAVGSWSAVPSTVDVQEKWMHGSAVLNGKLLAMADRGGVVFDPEASDDAPAWSFVSTELDLGWRGRAAVVDGVLYCYDFLGKIRGYSAKEDRWEEVKGIEKELPKFLCGATLANVGGRLCVVWEGKGRGKEMEIACAEIEVFRDSGGGLSGSVIWSDIVVLAVPRGSSVVNCLAVTL